MEQENKIEKCCCIGFFVVLFIIFCIIVWKFCAFFFSKFDDIKDSRDLLIFLFAGLCIVLFCLMVLCAKAADAYIKCKKVVMLKEVFLNSINGEMHKTSVPNAAITEITKSLAEKYKAFVDAVTNI